MVHQHLNGHDFGYNCKNYPINKIFHNSKKTQQQQQSLIPQDEVHYMDLTTPFSSGKKIIIVKHTLHTSFPIGYVAVVGWG